MDVTLTRSGAPWAVRDPAEKLAVRGMLPGAYGFDLAAHGARVARARGADFADLLALAMPSSWMVNNGAPSPVFRWWLSERRGAWAELCARLEGGTEAWRAASAEARDAVAGLCRSLAVKGHGACAISKVLAVLCPQTVPLMDDAAIAFALGAVPVPETADKPTADASLVAPMLDWFARAVRDAEAPLVELARGYEFAPLDAPQVLDRLLWMESWGWNHLGPLDTPAPRFWWLADGPREGIVMLEPPHPPFPTGARVDLAAVTDDAWRARAADALADL
jgi:hypothetical protein